MHRVESPSDPGVELFDLVAHMTNMAVPEGTGLPTSDLRWAAARRVITAVSRQILSKAGVPPQGSLFRDDARGITEAQQLALAQLQEPAVACEAGPSTIVKLGELYPTLMLPTARKQTGSWFTPADLTAPTVKRTLAPFLDGNSQPPRVCDPASGAGAFLKSALEIMAATGQSSPSELVTRCIFGVDTDPTAASLAALTLQESCGYMADIAAIERNVRCGDGLTSFDEGGFDAVIGNPPWETLQQSRREDTPDQIRLTAAQRKDLHDRFRLQGRGKLYTYRLFVERALQLLRVGGRLGLIVPASLYFDRDAGPLREHLLDECQWEWLFAFENSRRIFSIDRRYRFAVLVAESGGCTDNLRASFLRNDVAEWSEKNPDHLLYSRADVRKLSPHSGALLEVRNRRDLDLLEQFYAVGQPWLGSKGAWRWRQGDFNMTSDRSRFIECATAQRDGYRAQADGTWQKSASDPVLRPLYQGAMVYDLNPNAHGYAGGTGRGVRWRDVDRYDEVQPRYLIRTEDCSIAQPARTVVRALSNATNERTAVTCLLGDEPCGNSLGVLTPPAATTQPIGDCAWLTGVLGSMVWDWGLRQRLAGTNLNGFVLADTVLPPATKEQRPVIASLALRLCAVLPWHEPLWHGARAEGWIDADSGPALDPTERRRLRARLEIAVARSFGLRHEDLLWILRQCDHETAQLRDTTFTRSLDSRGFWRIDRELAPSERLPQCVLALAARELAD